MADRFDLRGFVAGVEAAVARHALGSVGAYARWTRSQGPGERHTGLDPYGCADAANLLYTIGRFPAGAREGFVGRLRGLQEPESGLFLEATHHPIHTTAHCLGALELFDARPSHPLRELAPLRAPGAIEAFLEALDWRANPWLESHRGAGAYAALVLAGETDLAFEDRYFAWLERECDAATGLWRRGCVPDFAEQAEWVFPHLAGTFHYLFNHLSARRPLPHPEALVDSGLALYRRRLFAPLGRAVGFAELDLVYCLARASELAGHRTGEVRDALARFAAEYVPWLLALDFDTDEGLDDLHRLFGATCALAELARALPGAFVTDRPLRLVLDRRPFV